MNPRTIIPADSPLRSLFDELVKRRRIVLFAGIPGVGKSLLVQQLVILAQRAGRTVHLLQWDVTRAAFETPEILRRYPEVDGLTHLAVRTAVGLWAREAVRSWHERQASPEHILIGEVTLLGNRLLALAEPHQDAAEPLLSGRDTAFVVPVPSRAVREAIEANRQRTIARPQHQREAADAPPNVMRLLWQDLHALANQVGIASRSDSERNQYDPDVYAAVYEHLLRQRHSHIVHIDEVLPHAGSVYDVEEVASELAATPEEVERVMEDVERRFRSPVDGGTTSSRF